jgi:acyl-CoA reductase-like NAD-dependent aldehyde dehydrogenase
MATNFERESEMATVELAREQLLIGGSWTDADGGRTFDQTFPYTGETVGRAAAAGRKDAHAAIDAAHAAFGAWGRSTPGERRTILSKAADLLSERAEQIAQVP